MATITPINVRRIASELLNSIIEGDFDREKTHILQSDSLSPEDRALFGHLTAGVLREWAFLGFCLASYAKKKSKPKTLIQFVVGAYQILFLDRVPEHAIFSEMKTIGAAQGLSKEELAFVHATLKKMQTDKNAWLKKREEAIVRLRETGKEGSELEGAVLNAPAALIDALTLIDEGKATIPAKREARARAVRALLAMKKEPSLMGYALEGSVESRVVKSPIAGEILEFTGGNALAKELKQGTVRVQGEASQWICEEFASEIAKQRGSKVKVLEQGSGKGGKLLGTLARLKRKDSNLLSKVEWVACESAKTQMEILKSSTMPLVQKYFSKAAVETCRELSDEHAGFDLVLCDAPCTGFGTLSKLPQIALVRGEKAYEEAKRAALLQRQLLDHAAQVLKVGGKCFYSVCTLTRPETVDLISELEKTGQWRTEKAQALWPSHAPAPEAEGFFLAVLTRI